MYSGYGDYSDYYIGDVLLYSFGILILELVVFDKSDCLKVVWWYYGVSCLLLVFGC